MAKKNSKNNKKQPWSIPLRDREDLYGGINSAANFDLDSLWSDGANPKLYNKEIINRKNKHDLGGWFKNTTGKLSDWNTNVTGKLMGSKFGQGLSNLGINSGNIGGITNTAATAIGGLIAGNNTTGVGKAMQGIGSLASNIPGVGGLIGAGVNLVGGLVNAAFGSNINEEFVNQTEAQARQQSNYLSGASDNASLLSDWSNMTFLGDVSKSDVGSDGWFSNKASRETARLNTLIDEANARALASISNTAENIDKQNDLMMLANYSAYGGPLNMEYTGVMSPFGNQFKDGGIFIKPSKRGTFTAAAKKRGMGVQEFASKVLANKENYSSAMVKKANFARNASKWHDNGGPLSDSEYYSIMERVAKDNYKEWGFENADEALAHALNDNTYNYRGYYSKYPKSKANADTHWTDEFKTVHHPTFSNESVYSGKVSQYNPEGLIGGSWDGETFIPADWQNKKAEGGELFTNGVTMIGNGGTHEQNPMEGVPMGIDPQGIPNLVEEGEVIYNDYVFSNRIRVPKAIRQKYKLRGITFADAAKQAQKESEERPNDPISKDGLNATMTMLQQEQEAIRLKKESNKYAKGGKLGTLYEGEGNKSNWLRYAPIAGHAIGVFGDLFSKPDYSAAETISDVDITPATVGYTPVGNYLRYTPFDRDYYINKLNANTAAGRRAIMNTSGGNRAAALAGLLATDYNYGTQLGDLARKAEEYNLAQRQAVEEFNRGTNMANAEMGLKAAIANAESRNKATQLRLSKASSVAAMRKAAKDAYDARRSGNINILLEELGELGTEKTYENWLDFLAKKGVLKVDSKGNITTASSNENSRGGKLRTKKKKGFTYG